MGVRLMVEVLDHWSDFGLTSGERGDLLIVAENANDQSRETFGSIHEPYILHRAGKSAESWKNVIGKLMKKKVLEHAREGGREARGRPGQVAKYRIPVLCPLGSHDGLRGRCSRDTEPEWVTSQMTHSKETGHSSGDPSTGMGHLRDGKWVTSQMTPPPLTPLTTSAGAEGPTANPDTLPGLEATPQPKKRPAPKKPASPELITAKDLTARFFDRYGTYYSQSKISVRKICQTALENGIDRDTLAWALDAIGRERRGITEQSLQYALRQIHARRGNAGGAASQRTAARCTEHRMVLPCSGCIGEIRSGDTETARRLLAEHGPEARADLAHHLKETA
jgi:hypothetical protein